MTIGYQIKQQDQVYFITLQVIAWVDIFSRECYRKVIVENLIYCQNNKGLEIYAWVIMSNHVHLIVKSANNNLSGTLRDFKSYTSKVILEMITNNAESRKEWMLRLFKEQSYNHKRNSLYQFWTHENHAVFIFSEKFMWQKLKYIHENPVRAGIVRKPEDYQYSSAVNYYDDGVEGLIDIIKVFIGWKTYS